MHDEHEQHNHSYHVHNRDDDHSPDDVHYIGDYADHDDNTVRALEHLPSRERRLLLSVVSANLVRGPAQPSGARGLRLLKPAGDRHASG
jgi:hypothetical protein